jgi:hypothetical protein
MVQVKLTVLRDPAKVSEIVPLISRYANSQNKVNGADFAANGVYHQTLEQLSRSVWAPAASGLQRGAHWYYERARGSYADDKARQGTPPQRRKWEQENPPLQKFTKTDLAKYEHAWLGLPHFVCSGAEKNFNKLAERMENDGEPLVDANYFRHLVAKMILFRTAERVFTGLDITGFRANSVAYAVAWLSDRSNRRIDLERIWKDQRLTPALVDALGIVCTKAHEHITNTGGNPGEWSKKEDCWKKFRDTPIALDAAWEKDWADSPMQSHTSEEDLLEAEWEKVRGRFLRDERTIQALESYTNREWVSKYRREPVATLAAHDWKSLKRKPGLGMKKLRVLVEMFAIAAAG